VPIELLKQEKYMKVLVEVLIMISPAIPHLSNECWSAIKDNLKTQHFDTVFNLHLIFNLL
jgi:hypothetical protein